MWEIKISYTENNYITWDLTNSHPQYNGTRWREILPGLIKRRHVLLPSRYLNPLIPRGVIKRDIRHNYLTIFLLRETQQYSQHKWYACRFFYSFLVLHYDLFWCMLYSSPINSWVVAHICIMNSLRPRQNGRHFPENIFIFLERKMYEFRLQFHWSLFLRVQFTIFQHRFKYWLCTDQATSPYLNQWWLDYRRIYASLGFSELNWVVIGSGNVWSPDQRQAFI